MEEVDFECEIQFKNVSPSLMTGDACQTEYLLCINTIQVSQFDPQNQRLVVDVEEKTTGELWRGDFQAKYIEEITNKTGVYKKFSVFIKMLLSAANQLSNAGGENVPLNSLVSLNLLNQQDLLSLKEKSGSSASKPMPSTSSITGGLSSRPAPDPKKYMILSFEGEFEKVHYPLPLTYQEEPDLQSMYKTFQRMQSQMEQVVMSRTSNSQRFKTSTELDGAQSEQLQKMNTVQDFFQIELENERLREELMEVQSNFTAQDHKYLEMSQQKEVAETEYEQYRVSAQNEILHLASIVKDKELELKQLQAQHEAQKRQAMSHASGFSIGDSDADKLKSQLKSLTQTFEEEKQRASTVLNDQDDEITKNQTEISEIETTQTKQRVRMQELQDELTQTIKRIEQLQRGGGFGYGGIGAGNRSNSRKAFGSGNRAGSLGSNRASPYGANGQRNARGFSNGSSGNRLGQNTNSNPRPVPSYMRPTGAARVARVSVPRSNERSGSYQRRKPSPAGPTGSQSRINTRPVPQRNNFMGGASGGPSNQRPSPQMRTGTNRISPNRGGISNLNGQTYIQRRAQGVRVSPGQTNFLERNKERLAQIAQRSKERKDFSGSQNRGSLGRQQQRSGERKPDNSLGRNAANERSQEARRARQPLYQAPAARQQPGVTGSGGAGSGRRASPYGGPSNIYQRSKERIAKRQQERQNSMTRNSGNPLLQNQNPKKFAPLKRSSSRGSAGRGAEAAQPSAAQGVTNQNPLNLHLKNGPPSVSSKIKEYKSNLLGDNKFSSQGKPSGKADPINDKLEKLTGLLQMAKNQH